MTRSRIRPTTLSQGSSRRSFYTTIVPLHSNPTSSSLLIILSTSLPCAWCCENFNKPVKAGIRTKAPPMPTSEPKTPATTPVLANRMTKHLMSRTAENNCYYCNAIQLAIDEEP